MCPRCVEPMVAYELGGIEIDRCVDCGGTWLDAGELEAIVEWSSSGAGGLSAALLRAGDGRKGEARCPRCGKHLRVIELPIPQGRIEGKTGIELDRCPAGCGLWLDKGEMRDLVRAFQNGEEGAVGKHFAELYRYELDE